LSFKPHTGALPYAPSILHPILHQKNPKDYTLPHILHRDTSGAYRPISRPSSSLPFTVASLQGQAYSTFCYDLDANSVLTLSSMDKTRLIVLASVFHQSLSTLLMVSELRPFSYTARPGSPSFLLLHYSLCHPPYYSSGRALHQVRPVNAMHRIIKKKRKTTRRDDTRPPSLLVS
jgi:hypothetical protein